MKNSLNEKFWKSENNLNANVRKNLLKIAKDFIETTKIKNLKIQDIVLVGSMANYTWHDKSDVDVHIIFDLTNFERHKKFIVEFVQAKKTIWNYNHDIKMFNHEIEIYPQDKDAEFESGGIYSLIKDEWIKKPELSSKDKKDTKIDKKYIMKKYQDKVDMILKIEENSKKKDADADELVKNIEKLITKLRDERQEGLQGEGESSPENLVYKMLRANGYIDKLKDLKHDVYDKDVSLKI
jgi:predicted nucleotidyltransferase